MDTASFTRAALLSVSDARPASMMFATTRPDERGRWYTEPASILTAIGEFPTGSQATSAHTHRALRTVLFTDMSPRRNARSRPVMSSGGRCCTALMRSLPTCRNASVARLARQAQRNSALPHRA